MKIDSKSIVIAAITLALTVAIAPIPFVFMLPLLFTCTTRGIKMSLFMGLAFGVTSLFYAFIMPSSPVAIAFVQAPWIPILARIMVAFCAHGAFILAKRLIKSNTKTGYASPYVISGLVGSISNTVIVVGLLLLTMPNNELTEGITILIYLPTILISGIIEAVVYSVLVPATSIATLKAMHKYGQNNQKQIILQESTAEELQMNEHCTDQDTPNNPDAQNIQEIIQDTMQDDN